MAPRHEEAQVFDREEVMEAWLGPDRYAAIGFYEVDGPREFLIVIDLRLQSRQNGPAPNSFPF
jgi:hypothetical protein